MALPNFLFTITTRCPVSSFDNRDEDVNLDTSETKPLKKSESLNAHVE